MGMLLRASGVIAVIAYHSPIHGAPGALPEVAPMVQAAVEGARGEIAHVDLDTAIKGAALAMATAQALHSLPGPIRDRAIAEAAGPIVQASLIPPAKASLARAAQAQVKPQAR